MTNSRFSKLFVSVYPVPVLELLDNTPRNAKGEMRTANMSTTLHQVRDGLGVLFLADQLRIRFVGPSFHLFPDVYSLKEAPDDELWERYTYDSLIVEANRHPLDDEDVQYLSDEQKNVPKGESRYP